MSDAAKPTNAMTRAEMHAHLEAYHGYRYAPGTLFLKLDVAHVRMHKDGDVMVPHVHRGDV